MHDEKQLQLLAHRANKLAKDIKIYWKFNSVIRVVIGEERMQWKNKGLALYRGSKKIMSKPRHMKCWS